MKVSLDFLAYLSDLFQIQARTPNRLRLILEHAIAAHVNILNKGVNDIEVPFFEDKNGDFILNEESLIDFEEHAKAYSCNKDVFQEAIILLPKINFCCKKLIRIDSRYSSITLYCHSRIIPARSYHGICKACHKSYYYSFIVDPIEKSRIFYRDADDEYMIISSGVGFSKKLLHYFDMQIFIGVVSFEAASEIYNNTVPIGNHNPLNTERLEEGFFLYKILHFVHEFYRWPRDDHSRVDIEKICEDVYETIRSRIDEKWLNHICNEEGCKNRFIVVDGNEKNYRAICTAEKTRIIGTQGDVNSYMLCTRNPIRGNQH